MQGHAEDTVEDTNPATAVLLLMPNGTDRSLLSPLPAGLHQGQALRLRLFDTRVYGIFCAGMCAAPYIVGSDIYSPCAYSPLPAGPGGDCRPRREVVGAGAQEDLGATPCQGQ